MSKLLVDYSTRTFGFHGETLYIPVVRFHTASGKPVEYTAPHSSSEVYTSEEQAATSAARTAEYLSNMLRNALKAGGFYEQEPHEGDRADRKLED